MGSVFQPRFFSEVIEGDDYLIAAVRYVHINPEKAGICEAAHYPWSSYREYAGGAGTGEDAGAREGLCATGLVLGLLGGVDGFSELCSGASAADVGFEGSVKLSSDEALEVANRAGARVPGRLRGEEPAHPAAQRRRGGASRELPHHQADRAPDRLGQRRHRPHQIEKTPEDVEKPLGYFYM